MEERIYDFLTYLGIFISVGVFLGICFGVIF